MSDPADSKSDLERGMEASPSGHPVVVFLVNVVLSALFASLVVYVAAFVGLAAYTPRNIVGVTLVVVILTHLLVRS